MQNILKVFKALSGETRLRVANLLLERECSVCEIMQALRISHTRASRGLTSLHNAGLLKARRDGLWILYSIDEEGIGEYYNCLQYIIRNSLKDSTIATVDKGRLKIATRVHPCVARAKLLSS